MKKILTALGFAILGAFLTLLFNIFILDTLLIPDPCYYHAHETNKLFDLFYELSAAEGYHPFPTTFNFICTLTVGALLGITFAARQIKNIQQENRGQKNF